MLTVYDVLEKNTSHHNTCQIIQSSDEHNKKGTRKVLQSSTEREIFLPPQNDEAGSRQSKERAEIRKRRPPGN